MFTYVSNLENYTIKRVEYLRFFVIRDIMRHFLFNMRHIFVLQKEIQINFAAEEND